MIDLKEASLLGEKKLLEIEGKSGVKLAFMENSLISFEFGWLFLYQSEEFIRTGNEDFLVGGNAPIIIDKYNSSVITTGTRMGKEFYIEKYCQYRDDINRFYDEIG